jgi:hypothetical protein
MKRSERPAYLLNSFLTLIFILLAGHAFGQETGKVTVPLPENINKIVSVSCIPCHSSSGGIMSRTKLNFSEWASYSAEKQQEKANKIYKEVSKDKMPPKSTREANPGIVPTKEQVETIKKWVDSFPAPEK